jgi:hypothetical protein
MFRFPRISLPPFPLKYAGASRLSLQLGRLSHLGRSEAGFSGPGEGIGPY